MIKYYTTLFLLLSLTSILSAQIISNEKDANNYYGIFGGIQGSGLPGVSFERYLNIGSNSIEVTQSNLIFGAKPDLTINGSGGTVSFGGEVNRAISSDADLLPYAYGRLDGFTSNPVAPIITGTENYTISQTAIATIITLNENIAFNTSVTVTPLAPDAGQGFNTWSPLLPAVAITSQNTIEIRFFDLNGNFVSNPYFSFSIFSTDHKS